MKQLATFQKFIGIFSFLALSFVGKLHAQTQLPECTDVTLFVLDMSQDPDSMFITPEITRTGQCCPSMDANENFISFYVTLHPSTAMVEIGILPGYADPSGSGVYNEIFGGDLIVSGICGPDITGGSPVCITGGGIHKFVYHKPGSNKVKYYLKQIPAPIFPMDDATRFGCELPLEIYGLDNISISAIATTGNASLATCDTYMQNSTTQNPNFIPGSNPTYPYTIDYRITGSPQASACGVYQSVDTLQLTVYAPLSVTLDPDNPSFCVSGAEWIVAQGQGGDGNYTYLWKNSAGTTMGTDDSLLVNIEGTYTVYVEDGLVSSTCDGEYESIFVNEGNPPVVVAGSPQTICSTDPTVYLSGSVQYGTGGYWTGGAGTYSPNDTILFQSGYSTSPTGIPTAYTPTWDELDDGFVTLTLHSIGAGGGCTNITSQVTITFIDTLYANPTFDPMACNGDSTTVYANPSGGGGSYNYFWSTGANTSSINAPAGAYSVMVVDQYGCGDNTPIAVTQPSTMFLTMSSTNMSDDITCDGTATVSVSGGDSPYTYLWSNLGTTATINTLCTGIYTVDVTDANGCTVSSSVVVNNFTCSSFNVGITAIDNIDCYGDTDGSATVSVLTGGAPGFTYLWSPGGQTTQTATGLTSGAYTVLVTDNVGCFDMAGVTITQPTIITNTMTHTDATSQPGVDGTATANPLGGTPSILTGYTYLWTPSGQTTQTAINLTSTVGGIMHYVLITDSLGCTKTDSVLINQPPCNNFMVAVNSSNVTCNGLLNGSASVIIAHGTAPYLVSWSNGQSGIGLTSISGLGAATYVVTVTDSKNCSTFQSFTITEPDPLSLALVPTNITCYNDHNGTIDLSIIGGSYPYSFSWSIDGKIIANHEDLVDQGPGTYTVTVTDVNGCIVTSSVGLSQPSELKGTFTYLDNLCYNYSTGSVDLTPVGGVFPYLYSWTGETWTGVPFSATTQDISGLQAGLYEFSITDLNGCSYGPKQVAINQPTLIVPIATMTQQVSCNNGNDGSASLSVSGGTPSYTYAWTGPLGFTATTQNISGLAAGTYFVTVTDSYGCFASTSVVVTTVVDVTPPIISCVGDQTESTSSTTCTYTRIGTAWDATATDNCLMNTLGYVLTGATTGFGSNTLNNVVFNIGVTTVTWTATDASGNTAVCDYDVTIEDNTAPVISNCGAGNQTVDANTGVCTYTHTSNTWNPIVFENCTTTTSTAVLSGATNLSGLSTLNGVVFNLGSTLVTWTVTDAANNSTTCSFTIIVEDNQNPTITCVGADQTVDANIGVCTYTMTTNGWNPTFNDNCSGSFIRANLTGATTATNLSTLNGVIFNLGTTTVTWTVTDGSNNTATCSFDVIVEDNQNPTITCVGASQTVDANTGVCTYTMTTNSWNPSFADNCSGSIIRANLAGATTATNLSTLNGVVFNLGTTTVTWTVTDGSNNTATCSFDVIVEDNQNPTITCVGASQTVDANTGVCTYTMTTNGWNPSFADNCSGSFIRANLTGATTATNLSTLNGVVFNLGTTTVTWTVTDGSNNTATCSFDVIVEDNQNPTITCVAANQTVNANTGVCTYTMTTNGWNPSFADNCSGSIIRANLTGATTATNLSTLNGVVFNLGTTTVTWTVTDGSNNTATCWFDVVVLDNQNPTITCVAASQIVDANTGVCTYTMTTNGWNPSFADNCSGSFIRANLTGVTTATNLTTLNGVVFNLGTTTVTWTVRDGSNNTATCSFDVIVEDNQNPTITCVAANQTVNANTGVCTYTMTTNGWNPSFADNCSGSIIRANLTGATTASNLSTLNGVVFNLGTTTVTWTVTDGSNNTATCSFDVIVLDNQNPTITCVATDQTVDANLGVCTYTSTSTIWDATFGDNCMGSSIRAILTGATTGSNLSTLNGVVFNLGTTTVTWTVTDGSNNTATCSFDVIVEDNQNPTITCVGASQIVDANTGVCTYTMTTNGWNPSFNDNCSGSFIRANLSGATTATNLSTLNGVVFNLGTTTVTWTVTDGSNNIATCSFDVIVEDNQDPIISACPSTITIGSDNGDCGAIVSWTPPTFTDNCGASMTSTHNPGDFFSVGFTTVTYTVTDGSGNVTICAFDVIVNDDEAPVITCSTPIETCIPLVSYALPVSTDNCGINASTLTQLTGLGSNVVYPVGVTSNTYEITDIHGNSSTCTFTVTVFPVPVISMIVTDVTCNGNGDGTIDATVTTGTEPYTYSWTNGADTEDISGLVPSTYSLTVVDDNGCTASAATQITEPEVLTLQANVLNVNCFNGSDGSIEITVEGGTFPYAYLWNGGETTEDLFSLEIGSYDVTVTDFNGCIINYATTITQPDTLLITANIFSAICNAANGNIEVQVTGGTQPYEFLWSDGSTGMSLYNVLAGDYTFTVTDNNNCVNTYSGTIETTTKLEGSLIAKDARCFGQNNGELLTVIESGYAPFTYEWSNGQTASTATGLDAGTYSVLITDYYGCQMTLTGDVSQPDSLYVVLSTSLFASGDNISEHNGSDGYVNSQAYGGTSPYDYAWTGSNGLIENTQNISNLEAGAYIVTVTDDQGCVATATSRLTEPDILEMPSGFSPNGDDANENFVVHGIEAYPENQIIIYNRWGNIVFETSNYANEWHGENMQSEPLPDATYFVVLTVEAGDEQITLTGYVDLRR